VTATPTRGRASAAIAGGRGGASPRSGGPRRNRDSTGSRAGTRAGSRATTAKKPAAASSTSSLPDLRTALDKAQAKTAAVRTTLPVLGKVMFPSPQELVFIAGVGVLAVVGALEWPVAAVVVTGHVLAAGARNRTIQEIGEALQEA
jgi:hypothetical protein